MLCWMAIIPYLFWSFCLLFSIILLTLAPFQKLQYWTIICTKLPFNLITNPLIYYSLWWLIWILFLLLLGGFWFLGCCTNNRRCIMVLCTAAAGGGIVIVVNVVVICSIWWITAAIWVRWWTFKCVSLRKDRKIKY